MRRDDWRNWTPTEDRLLPPLHWWPLLLGRKAWVLVRLAFMRQKCRAAQRRRAAMTPEYVDQVLTGSRWLEEQAEAVGDLDGARRERNFQHWMLRGWRDL